MPSMAGRNDIATPVASNLDGFSELATMPLDGADPRLALDEVVRVACSSVPVAAGVSITMLLDGKPTTAAYVDRLCVDLDLVQYRHDSGPSLDAGRGGEVQRVDDMRGETRWPDFTAAAVERRVLSSLSVPLPSQGSVAGALTFYAKRAAAFDQRDVPVALALASYGAVSLFGLRVFGGALQEAESLQRAMSSRAVIEQSKGMLMARHECTAQQAFDMLVRQSQARDVRPLAVAQEVVGRARPRGPAAGSEGQVSAAAHAVTADRESGDQPHDARFVVAAERVMDEGPLAHLLLQIGALTATCSMTVCGHPAEYLEVSPGRAWSEVGQDERCMQCAQGAEEM